MAAARARKGESHDLEVMAKREEIVKLLLDKGADMEMKMTVSELPRSIIPI